MFTKENGTTVNIKTEKNFKYEKIAKILFDFTSFEELHEK